MGFRIIGYPSHMGESGSKDVGVCESLCAHSCMGMCERDLEIYLFTVG